MNGELIERFFKKQCTVIEAEQVAAYLKANPLLLEKYVSLHDWNTVEAGDIMPEEFWNEVWLGIQKKNKAKIIYLRLKRFAAAACIILFITTAYYYFIPAKKISRPFVYANALPKPQHKLISNITKKAITVVLEDSSAVQLSPGSYLEYDTPFANDKRDVILEGEARFRVAKNKSKPFTVFAGALATTALGTIFSIKKTAGSNHVIIKLFQGKVAVHSTDDNLKGWKNDVYLLPGEQLQFNEALNHFAVEKINNNNTAATIKKDKQRRDDFNGQLTFINTLLPEVMNRLSAYYNVKILYDTLLIDTINFTGIVSKTDSLTAILKAIGVMNDLEIIKENNEFIISKHQ